MCVFVIVCLFVAVDSAQEENEEEMEDPVGRDVNAGTLHYILYLHTHYIYIYIYIYINIFIYINIYIYIYELKRFY